MSLSTGDRVRFKGDPDGVEYLVDFENDDETYDVHNPLEGSAQGVAYVPERLLEKVPGEPIRFGSIYRGKHSGATYLVLSKQPHSDTYLLFDASGGVYPTESGKNLRSSLYYQLVRQGAGVL